MATCDDGATTTVVTGKLGWFTVAVEVTEAKSVGSNMK